MTLSLDSTRIPDNNNTLLRRLRSPLYPLSISLVGSLARLLARLVSFTGTVAHDSFIDRDRDMECLRDSRR